jgi:hypothetical protein
LLELRLINLIMAGDKEDLPRGLSWQQAQVVIWAYNDLMLRFGMK